MLRTFLAIFLPDNLINLLKKETEIITKKIGHFHNFRVLPENQWHITLHFFGNQSYENIIKIKNAMEDFKNLKLNHEIEIELEKIVYGPIESKIKRMVWLTVSKKTNFYLSESKNYLFKLFQENNLFFEKETRNFYGHITLIRFQNKLINQLPFLEKDFCYKFKFNELSLMQSILTKNGSKYNELFKIKLN